MVRQTLPGPFCQMRHSVASITVSPTYLSPFSLCFPVFFISFTLLTLSLSLCLSVFHSYYFSLCFSVFLSLSIPLFLSLSLSLSLTLSLTHYSLSDSLFHSLFFLTNSLYSNSSISPIHLFPILSLPLTLCLSVLLCGIIYQLPKF